MSRNNDHEKANETVAKLSITCFPQIFLFCFKTMNSVIQARHEGISLVIFSITQDPSHRHWHVHWLNPLGLRQIMGSDWHRPCLMIKNTERGIKVLPGSWKVVLKWFLYCPLLARARVSRAGSGRKLTALEALVTLRSTPTYYYIVAGYLAIPPPECTKDTIPGSLSGAQQNLLANAWLKWSNI